MNRREMMLAGVAGATVWAGSPRPASAKTPAELLRDYGAVPWQKYAVMRKPEGQEPPWKLRLTTEHALISAGGRAAGAELVRATQSKDAQVRALAAQMLGVLGNFRAEAALSKLLQSDPSGLVRSYAAEAVSRLEGVDAGPLLAQAVNDSNRNVKWTAQQSQLRLRKKFPSGAALQRRWTEGFDAAKLASAKVGQSAPDFTLESAMGGKIKLSQYRGKQPVVVLFQLADW